MKTPEETVMSYNAVIQLADLDGGGSWSVEVGEVRGITDRRENFGGTLIRQNIREKHTVSE